jgi:vacuolar-type H+-ATPase subunit F/Vma7
MGNSALMDGFALLGMETYPDASVAEVEQILTQLSHSKERAMIYLQQDLAQADLPILQFIRNEGGNILISEIPDILSAQDYQAPVDQLLTRVLGASAVQDFTHEE